MRAHLFTILGLTISLTASSQTEVDLYRYSNTFNEGSARFESMAGSFGALGAETGAARINPAGFGRYSNSSFNFSLGNISLSNSSAFNGNTTKANDNRFKIPNVGLVLTSDISASRGGWLYQQFGAGYNSVANFNNTIKYSGEQYYSLLDGFATQAFGLDSEGLKTYYPFSSDVAYQTYAIDPDGAGNYFTRIGQNSTVRQTRTIDNKGGIGELFFSYSGNYLNKLYVGANVGIQFLNYSEAMTHHEDILNPTQSLQSFDYFYNYKTKGNGTNLKLGAIYLPVESVRIGLAFHTPTYFELTDSFDASMTAYHDTMTNVLDPSIAPVGQYKYKLRTPARYVGSFAYVFEDHGCINIDLEYLDYRKANFKSTNDAAYTSYSYDAENAAADARFTTAINLRIGGEVVVFQNYFIRGGYAMYQKGDKNLKTFGGKYDSAISGGAGVRLNNWTLDAAVKTLNQTRNYIAFPDSGITDITTKSLYIVLSAQVKF